jgi:hypothetical protein
MCTVLAVRDPKETTKEEWEDTMFPALSSERYVTGSFAARVYGLNQIPDYKDIPDGSEAAVLVSTQCDIAVDTAEKTTGTVGIRLMVRLGMEDLVPLPDYHHGGANHGQLPKLKGRKFAYYSLVVADLDWLNEITDEICEKLPNGQEMIRIFREDGGEYIGRTNTSDEAQGFGSLILTLLFGRRSNSEQFLIKSSVTDMQDGIAGLRRLQSIPGVGMVVAFIEE